MAIFVYALYLSAHLFDYYYVSKTYEKLDTLEKQIVKALNDKLNPAPNPNTFFPDLKPNPDNVTVGSGSLIINADAQGHFRGNFYINNVLMPCIIDTGATTTTIPFEFAQKAGLPIGQLDTIWTANGNTNVQKTQIRRMQFGNIVLKDVNAYIGYALPVVLVGMNTLKHFKIETSNNKMTLTAISGSSVQVEGIENQKPTWKKDVVCDGKGENCRTVYSN